MNAKKPDLEPQELNLIKSAKLFRDGDSQEISSGRTILEADSGLGVFWPEGKFRRGTRPENASTLAVSGGSTFRVLGIWNCSSGCQLVGSHLHFHVLEIPDCRMSACPIRTTARVIIALSLIHI